MSEEQLLKVISEVYEELYEKSIENKELRKEYSLKCKNTSKIVCNQ